MRIISNFHDYYDTAMGYGMDYDIIWLRKEKKVKQPPRIDSYISRSMNSGSVLDISVHTHIIGFCGKIYGCVELWLPDSNERTICYKIEEIDAFIDTNCKKKQKGYYYSKQGDRRYKFGYWWYKSIMGWRRGAFEKYFEKCEKFRDDHEQFFLDNNTPVFIDNIINAKLKDLEFYRVFDPYTAFQEIQMFYGRLKSPEKPIPKISDADMLEAKGFDPKWSFRKEPGKKRKRKKNDG